MNGQTKILEWYRYAYPTDGWAIENLNRIATFDDALECLEVGFNFYTFLGVSDSIVRERVFEALANLIGKGYDYVYKLWLRG